MKHSVPIAQPRTISMIEALALSIVESFQPDVLKQIGPFQVETFLDCELEQRTGITSVYKPLGPGLFGYTNIEERQCVISTVLADSEDIVDRRMLRATAAHELGHCFLHVEEFLETRAILRFEHDKQHLELTLHSQDEVQVFRNPEWQAWRFAQALLMPEHCVRAAVKAGWTKKLMSNAFDVNPSFLEVRLRALKIGARIRNG